MKYAMVAINTKQDDSGNQYIRRVLISYKKYIEFVFYGTKYIECDGYFKDPDKSHKYEFHDRGYKMITGCDWDKDLRNITRPYHHNPYCYVGYDLKKDILAPILFECDTVEEAVKRFSLREERR